MSFNHSLKKLVIKLGCMNEEKDNSIFRTKNQKMNLIKLKQKLVILNQQNHKYKFS